MVYELFKKWGNDCSYFIETGTYKGGSIDTAKLVGFERYYSVEYLTSLYQECLEKFKDHDDVFLYNGSSEDCLVEILKDIDKKSLFWLDAHDTFGTGGGVPTYEELKVIKEHQIKEHTLIIDDIPLYFGDGEEIKNKILEINLNYKFLTYDPDNRPDYILIAYVDNNNKNI